MTLPAGPLTEPADRRREQRAWYFYDWANSAYVTTTSTVLFAPYLTVVAKRAACPGQDTELACTTNLHVLGIPVSPGSLALYAVTLTTLLSAVILPIVGAIADVSANKKSLMAKFAWVGSLAAASMYFVAGTNWQLGVVLLMIAGLCLGSSLVIYDSILCDIAEPDERDGVSSRGWALGYAGGGILLALNLTLINSADALGLSTEQAVRISLLTAGLWWAAFTLIPYWGLKNRPAAVQHEGKRPNPFTQLGRTLAHMAGYRQTWMFLLAYLFFNDGIQTVIASASVYGQEELKLDQGQLITTILVVQFVALGGALLFGKLAARIGAWRSILLGVVLWCLVVAFGYGIPQGAFGLFLALGAAIGIVMGGTQALSRSMFSQLIPRGREAEYFSLYQATERGTSWFGTLLFGVVYQVTGNYRNAIIALVLLFVIGGTLLSRVDVRRGIIEAGNEPPAIV